MFNKYGCKLTDEMYEKVKKALEAAIHPVCIASELGLSPSEVYAVATALNQEKLFTEKEV